MVIGTVAVAPYSTVSVISVGSTEPMAALSEKSTVVSTPSTTTAGLEAASYGSFEAVRV